MKKINKILIANRGEIASRIIKSCKSLGIFSVAVFTEADRYSLYVNQADSSIFIGENNPFKSYLNIDVVVNAAIQVSADAIHPGYGFLSENALFAKKCIENNIIFIGPSPEIIEKMGSKSKAKDIMRSIGVPIIKGYNGKDQSLERLINEAKLIGFPILLKPALGGGGKGMRIVNVDKELKDSILGARRESLSSFGSDELIIEKYLPTGRHIEFQIFGDKHGNGIHILERECTIQRRYQKIIEESPSPVMDDKLRDKMGNEVIKIIKALNYDNAGTVEFIYDDSTGEFYFLEVNTRLQVEHPVTEMITNLDLVALQIEVSQGEQLNIKQEQIKGNGYAIEVRLYAENTENNFLPESGKIELFEAPEIEGFRIETSLSSGSEISIHYDSMIAKLIVWDITRERALRKMHYVLKNLKCIGVVTNQNMLKELFENQDFKKGNYDIHFIDHFIKNKQITKDEYFYNKAIIAAILFDWYNREKNRKLLKNMDSGWRNNFYKPQTHYITLNDKTIKISYIFNNDYFNFHVSSLEYKVKLSKVEKNTFLIEFDGLQEIYSIFKNQEKFFIHNITSGNVSIKLKQRFPSIYKENKKGEYKSPIPSQIIKILVEIGQKVAINDPLIILSSMKIENIICAYESGIVKEIKIKEGENIESGTFLLNIESIK